MKLDLEKEETLMAEATKVVYQSGHHILSFLEASNTTVDDTLYVFSSSSTSPNGNKLVASIKNQDLIMAVSALLKLAA